MDLDSLNARVGSQGAHWSESEKFRGLLTTPNDLAHLETAEFLWHELLVAQHYAVWCAPPNAGKTTIAWHAAKDLAADMRVVYVHFDASAVDLTNFAIEACKHEISLISNVNASADDVHEFLSELISEADLSDTVIFLDTLKKFCDLNDKRSKHFYELIRQLTAKGCTVIALSHTTKREEADGSRIFDGVGDLEQDCDEMLMMRHVLEANEQTVSCEFRKQRAKVKPITFRWNLDDRNVEAVDYENLSLKSEWANLSQDMDSELKIVLHFLDQGEQIQTTLVETLIASGCGQKRALRLLKAGSNFAWSRKKGNCNSWVYTPLQNLQNPPNQ